MIQERPANSFKGFPKGMKYSSLPAPFFTTILSQIDDIDELKVTLTLLYLITEKKRYPRFISEEELIRSNLLKKRERNQYDRGLNKAVERGTFLLFPIERNGEKHNLYFFNAEPERKMIEKIREGELAAGSLEETAFVRKDKNIFTLYEENIGQLTSILAEELTEAEKAYPFQWIEDAFKEAAAMNRRNWRYISRILERWAAEGKSGETGRHNSKKFNPQDYFKGRYGHIVHRPER